MTASVEGVDSATTGAVVGTLATMLGVVTPGPTLPPELPRPALISLGCVLVIVTFGHLLHAPLYAFHEHVIPRLALVLLVLLLPREWDRFSIDRLAEVRAHRE